MILIEEYRAALVAAVVTGQLDVRTAEIAADNGPPLDAAEFEPEPEDALEPALAILARAGSRC